MPARAGNGPAIRELIAGLIEKSGSGGFSFYGVTRHGYSATRAHTIMSEFIARGDVFRGKIGHRTVRFFRQEEWARQYEASRPSGVAPAVRVMVDTRARARWPADAPTHFPVDASGNPLYRFTSGAAPALGHLRTGWGCGLSEGRQGGFSTRAG